MEGTRPTLGAPTVEPMLHDFDCEHIKQLDGGSTTVSESDYTDGQTEPTTVDDAENADRTHSYGSKLGTDAHDEDLHKPHRITTSCAGQENSDPSIYVNRQIDVDKEVIDVPLGSTDTSTDRDQLAIKLEQDAGSGRDYHQPGTSDRTLGPGAEGIIDIRPSLESTSDKVNALWTNPEESTSMAILAIQRVRELNMLPGSTVASPSRMQVANTLAHGTSNASEPFAAADVNGGIFARLNNAEDKQVPTEEDWEVFAPPLDAALQVRLDVYHGRIHRLMSSTGNIDFNVDIASFTSAGIDQTSVQYIIDAARVVAQELTRLRFGMTFSYSPTSRREVFSIRCDPSIPFPTLAQAFFPSQRRGPRGWQLRVSPFALHPYHFQQDRRHMVRTLAHEFMHILGFRHYNAALTEDGTHMQSVLWPGTTDANPNSIMYTAVHNRLWLSAEDVKVLRELYSKRNGYLVRGREIRDVNAHRGP